MVELWEFVVLINEYIGVPFKGQDSWIQKHISIALVKDLKDLSNNFAAPLYLRNLLVMQKISAVICRAKKLYNLLLHAKNTQSLQDDLLQNRIQIKG